MKICIKIAANEHGGYTAICPSLPGCTTRGETREEAQDRLSEVICGYIASVSDFVPENVNAQLVEA